MLLYPRYLGASNIPDLGHLIHQWLGCKQSNRFIVRSANVDTRRRMAVNGRTLNARARDSSCTPTYAKVRLTTTTILVFRNSSIWGSVSNHVRRPMIIAGFFPARKMELPDCSYCVFAWVMGPRRALETTKHTSVRCPRHLVEMGILIPERDARLLPLPYPLQSDLRQPPWEPAILSHSIVQVHCEYQIYFRQLRHSGRLYQIHSELLR